MVNYIKVLTITFSNWPHELGCKENIGDYLYDLRIRKASLSRKTKEDIIKRLKYISFHRKSS